MKIRLFETFAGVGSQHTALRDICETGDTVELAGISEWDMYAVLAYYRMNGYSFNDEYSQHLNDNEVREFFKSLPYSLDSKKLSDRVASQPIQILRKLYEAHNKLGNIPDVTTLTGEDIIKRNVNLLTYSFPCQDLSTAGHGKGMAKDGDTRSGLLWEIERLLEEINSVNEERLPKFLLMENVAAIISKNHVDDYNLWRNKLNKLGYISFDGILDARDAGVPQQRRRFFCISIYNYDGKFDSLETNDINKIIRHYLGYSNLRSLTDYLRIDYTNPIYKAEADLATPNHTLSRYKMYEKERNIIKYSKGRYIINPELHKTKKLYMRTLTTKQDRWNNAGMIDYREKEFKGKALERKVTKGNMSEFRFITNREAFLAMGFSEAQYNSLCSENINREKQYRQAGNSISVDVLKQIFTVFIKGGE